MTKLPVLAVLLAAGQVAGAADPPPPPPVVSMMANYLVPDARTTEVFLQRFEQTIQAGSNYLVGNATWAELEPQPGTYNVDGLRFLAYLSATKKLRVSFTLRIIDGPRRGTPSYLDSHSWESPYLQDRLNRLIDVIAPILRGRAEWFILGYEINPYFAKHPSETEEFAGLFKGVKTRIKQTMPGTQVSSALIFTDLGDLNSKFSLLDAEMDFLTLTYIPTRAGWLVWDPSVVPGDVTKMKVAANKRKILLLEVAYPSSSVAGSSPEQQARFYQAMFAEFRRDPGAFSAAAFMLLGDLSVTEAANWAYYFGISEPAFAALMQTLGVFDGAGNPKPGWTEFRDGAASLKSLPQ